jgi:hypothetical protein
MFLNRENAECLLLIVLRKLNNCVFQIRRNVLHNND